MKSRLHFVKSMREIKKSQFTKLLNSNDAPFIKYSFLDSLEKSNCVGNFSGWEPNHLVSQAETSISGFLPLYIKNNSQGEFVFDHSWSYALSRIGRKYYPKLLTAIPFTPCETRKIVSKNNSKKFIKKVISLMNDRNIESWHILFPDKKHTKVLKENNFVERHGYKFIWENFDYKSFDDFLIVFKSRQRKNIKNERKKISDMDIKFEIKDEKSLTIQDWDDFFIFYKNTYDLRLQRPYLNLNFFKNIHENRKELKPVIFFAKYKEKNIAASLCFHNGQTLYGRHWGSTYHIDSLHFETCFYQGIEFCIKNKIKFFDPGVQGEHKIRRGFEPQRTQSFHYLKENDFRDAIQNFCSQEKKEVANYIKACQRYTPFKKGYKI